MKTLSALLISCLFAIPAVAGSKLDQLPKSLLHEGLDSVVVCMTVDAVGITAMDKLSGDTEADLNDMKESAQILLESMTEESKLGNAIMDSLSSKYNEKVEQIGNELEQLSKTTRAELDDQIKDVTSFSEFKEKYASRFKACSDRIHGWTDKVRKILTGPLDNTN